MRGENLKNVPEDRRCQATKANGDPCPNYAIKGALFDGIRKCSGHAGKGAKARAVKAEKKADRQDEAMAERLRRAENREVLAEKAVREDPMGRGVTFVMKVSEQAAAAEHRRKLEQEAADLKAARLQEPPRTPEMEAAGEYWVRKFDQPGHHPINGVYDSEVDAFFVWVREVLKPNPAFAGPRNHRPVDRDVHRLLVERMPQRKPPNKATLARLREVKANPYALHHWAGEYGMEPEEYLASLVREVDAVLGYDVDLNDDGSREWHEIIRPEIERVARRGAWKGVGPIA